MGPYLGVVELTRLGQLTLTPNGGVDAPQMGQRGRIRQTIEHLPAPVLSMSKPACMSASRLACTSLSWTGPCGRQLYKAQAL